MLRVTLSISFLILFSCTSDVNDSRYTQQKQVHWRYLTFELNDSILQFDAFADTAQLITYKGGAQKFLVQSEVRDSLYLFSNYLLSYGGQPEYTCTDYVSRLKIHFQINDQVYKEVVFSSICNWRKIDTNTIRISNLINRVFTEGGK